MLDLAYQGWLHVSVGYSPNAPRYVPYHRLIERHRKIGGGEPAAADPRQISATAGIGYSYLAGRNPAATPIGASGRAYDLAAGDPGAVLCRHLGGS